MYVLLFAGSEFFMDLQKKKIKSHVSCLSVCIDKSNIDCPTWKYPVYELLYRSVPSPFFQKIQCNVHTLHQILLREKSCFHGSKGEELRQGRTKWRNCRRHLAPAYVVSTSAVSTYVVFGLCMC